MRRWPRLSRQGRRTRTRESSSGARRRLRRATAGSTGSTTTVELRDESLLRLFFADSLPQEQALMLLEGRKRGHEELLAALRQIEALPGGKDPTFVDLVLHWGIDFNEWGAQWCERQLGRLRKQKAA